MKRKVSGFDNFQLFNESMVLIYGKQIAETTSLFVFIQMHRDLARILLNYNSKKFNSKITN